jgi:hypothetical protein
MDKIMKAFAECKASVEDFQVEQAGVN